MSTKNQETLATTIQYGGPSKLRRSQYDDQIAVTEAPSPNSMQVMGAPSPTTVHMMHYHQGMPMTGTTAASSQIGQYAAPASPANTNSRASSFANVQPIAVPYPNNHPPTPPISPTNQTSAAASRKIKYKSNGDPEKKRGRKPGTKNRSKEEIRAEREKPKNPVGRPRKDRNNGAQSTVAAGPPVVQLFLPIFDPRLLTPSNTAGQVTSPPTDYHQAGQQSNQSVGFGVTNPGTYQAGQAIDSQSDYPVGSKRNQSVDSGYNSPPSDRADHSFADQYINFEGNSPTNDPASRATDPVPHHHLANETPKDVNMDGSSPANSAAVVAGFDWTKWDLAN